MGHLYVLFGKSASGKDTFFQKLIEEKELNMKRIVPYTTRPIRTGEEEGKEYHFVSEDEWKKLSQDGKVLESRTYHTVHGDWTYFTVADGQIDWNEGDYLLIGTLEAFLSIRKYYGEGKVIPIYIEVEDGVRLKRALEREMSQNEPKYAEMCRRFLADCEDFSEEKLKEAGVPDNCRFQNTDFDSCWKNILEMIFSK